MTSLVLQYEIDEPSVAVKETEAETVVLIHGFPDTPAMWTSTANYFSAEGFRIIRVALPGFEENAAHDPSSVNAISFDEVTDALHEVLSKEAAIDATIVGHDWGAIFLYLLTNKYPQVASKVVCLDIGLAPRSLLMLFAVLSYQGLLNLGFVLGPGLGDIIVRLVCWLIGAPRYKASVKPRASHAWLYRQAWREAGQRGPPLYYYRNLVESWKPREDLPFLFMYGDGLPKPVRFHTAQWRETVTAMHPLSDAIGLSGRHWFMLDRPEEFHGHLLKFLRS